MASLEDELEERVVEELDAVDMDERFKDHINEDYSSGSIGKLMKVSAYYVLENINESLCSDLRADFYDSCDDVVCYGDEYYDADEVKALRKKIQAERDANTIKNGDLVVAVETSARNSITEGNVYTVLDVVGGSSPLIIIIGDRGEQAGVCDYRFRLAGKPVAASVAVDDESPVKRCEKCKELHSGACY